MRAHLLRASRPPVAGDGGDELRHREGAVHARAGLSRGDVLRLAAVALGSFERLLPREQKGKEKGSNNNKKRTKQQKKNRNNNSNASNKHGVSGRERERERWHSQGLISPVDFRAEIGNESKS